MLRRTGAKKSQVANQPCRCGSGLKTKNCCGKKPKQNFVAATIQQEQLQATKELLRPYK